MCSVLRCVALRRSVCVAVCCSVSAWGYIYMCIVRVVN